MSPVFLPSEKPLDGFIGRVLHLFWWRGPDIFTVLKLWLAHATNKNGQYNNFACYIMTQTFIWVMHAAKQGYNVQHLPNSECCSKFTLDWVCWWKKDISLHVCLSDCTMIQHTLTHKSGMECHRVQKKKKSILLSYRKSVSYGKRELVNICMHLSY